MTDEEIIERGFVPWMGGDKAPADWDGGNVLHENGGVWRALDCQWKWGWPGKPEKVDGDIIGYRRKQSYPANLTPETAWHKPEARAACEELIRVLAAKGDEKARAIMAELEPVDPLAEAFAALPDNFGGCVDGPERLREELAKRNLKIVESTHD